MGISSRIVQLMLKHYTKCIYTPRLSFSFQIHFWHGQIRRWPPEPRRLPILPFSCNASLRNLKPALLNPLSENIGVKLQVMLEEVVLSFFFDHLVGLEFVNQLCVDDDERAATLVAVSNK